MECYSVGETVTIFRDDHIYASHPAIEVLDSGEWLVAFNYVRRHPERLHPPEDPFFRNAICRSADWGRSWGMPEFVPSFDWYGVECPGLRQLRSGEVVLSQFRFAWYPLGLARRRREAGERIAIALERRQFTEKFTDADWERSCYPWARGFHGLYLHFSCDGGRTFQRTVRVDTSPYRDGYTRTGVVELSDGRLAYALEEHPYLEHNFIVFSHDGGLSWSRPTLICETKGLIDGEPDLLEVAPGRLLCVLRDSRNTGYLHFCRSDDGGRTWSAPDRSRLFGHPGHLLKLRDGRIVCTYGRRSPPFGIRACLSEDGGRTWRVEDELVVRDDLPNGDLGYPASIEYAPGKLFVCYYGQGQDGVTGVLGTYVNLG
ncbi:MAG: exo-alpha-sialidase [Anaerolineae bacterium]|nr:exo-alpha-sialidase [Anaerolineae bacterium]